MSKRRIKGIYKALITQAGSNDPTVIEMENTLLPSGASIVWTRDIAGTYTGTLIGAFIVDSTTVIISAIANNFAAVNLDRDIAPDTIIIVTLDVAGVPTDGILTDSYISIEVFE